MLALIVSRILHPGSKYATASALQDHTHSQGAELKLENVHENEIYQAMDWLYKRKGAIEKELAARHLKEGSLVLCDVTSTYVVGHGVDLAAFGYSRDKKKGAKQINFGLLCDKEGRPVEVEVFSGATADPATLTVQLKKLKERFGLSRVTIVGDRGLVTHARLSGEVRPAGWITGLRKGAIRSLVQKEDLQLTLFDEMDLAEITSDDYPGERLVVCRNPFQAKTPGAAPGYGKEAGCAPGGYGAQAETATGHCKDRPARRRRPGPLQDEKTLQGHHHRRCLPLRT